MRFQLYFILLFTISESLASDLALEPVVYQWHKAIFFAPLHKFPVSNCGCKAFLQFKGWFLTVTGSKDDLKGIFTLQPTCSIFHLPSLRPYVPLFKLHLTLENWGRTQVSGLAAMKECSWWKLLSRTGFPTVGCVLSPQRSFFLWRQTLTSGWSLDIPHGRVSATSLLDRPEGTQSYKCLIWPWNDVQKHD